MNATRNHSRTKGSVTSLNGQTFGLLTVVNTYHHMPNPIDGRTVRMCFCRCECGKSHTTRAQALLSGGCQSCGCSKSTKKA